MKIIINAVIENEDDEFIATHNTKDGDLIEQIVLDANTSQVVIDVNDGDTLTVQDVVEVQASGDIEISQKSLPDDVPPSSETLTPVGVDTTASEG